MDLHAENGVTIPVLHCGDLTLRPLEAGDSAAVVAALNVWDVTKWLTGVPYPYGPEDFDWFLNTFIPETDHTVWAIDAGDGLIGCVGVRPELGYWLAPAHHGQGIMTRAATCVVNWYFARWSDDLTSGYHLGNGPSPRVLRKLGFEDTFVRTTKTVRGDSVDIQRMALTRENWQVRHG